MIVGRLQPNTTARRVSISSELSPRLARKPPERSATDSFTRFARPTLALDQEDELLQLALVEVGDGAERHP
jgi:hypothetical protein